jgi:hypothetical protein
MGPVCVDANDKEIQRLGMIKRLGAALPPLDPVFLSRLEATTRDFIKRHGDVLVPLSEIDDLETWLSKTDYNISRKDGLRRTAAAVLQCLKLPDWILKRFSKVKSFVKVESYPLFKMARWINSRVDDFKVFWGPACRQIEEALFQLPYFIKHVPVPLRPGKIENLIQGGARYYATDYSSFEALIRPEVMRATECVLYRHMLSKFPEYADVVCDTLTGPNRLTSSHWKVVIGGRRMSGDMNTSLGNGFINLMLWMTMCDMAGIPRDHWSGFVEGDDGIFAVYSNARVWTEQEWLRAGFRLKMASVSDPRLASFCGIISAVGEIVRDPYAFLSTFGWSSSMVEASERICWDLLHAKALSAIYETPQCPIVGALSRYALSCVPPTSTPRYVEDGYHKPPPDFALTEFAPALGTRQCFERVYGISVPTQIYVESLIQSGRLGDVYSALPLQSPERSELTAVEPEYGSQWSSDSNFTSESLLREWC